MKLSKDAHKELGVSLNGEVWSLLETESRTPEEGRRMVHAAHASHYHWLHAGGAVNEQRGEWLLSHVYAALGIGEAALRHAKRCAEITEEHETTLKDFDLAYAVLGLARANTVLGNTDQASRLKQESRKLGDRIADREDKQIFDGDFDRGDWRDVE